ncbi:MAG: phosphoribosylanthranilate isomerase [Eubacteriales bacterium]
MTKIKLCGLSRICDIETANELRPDYIGFVFAPNSRRYVSPEQAWDLKRRLDPAIRAVGVFVREKPETVAGLLNEGLIEAAQLHGGESEDYLRCMRTLTDRPLIRAFRIDSERDAAAAEESTADGVLLDSGAGGTGTRFDWALLRNIHRPFFLAGGLDAASAARAVETLRPYAVDVSSGIETDGKKDPIKMREFIRAVRDAERKEKQ